MYICICNAVTDRQIRAAVSNGAQTLEDLQIELGVACNCGRCAHSAMEYLPGGRLAPSAAPPPLQGTPVVPAANDPRLPAAPALLETVVRRRA